MYAWLANYVAWIRTRTLPRHEHGYGIQQLLTNRDKDKTGDASILFRIIFLFMQTYVVTAKICRLGLLLNALSTNGVCLYTFIYTKMFYITLLAEMFEVINILPQKLFKIIKITPSRLPACPRRMPPEKYYILMDTPRGASLTSLRRVAFPRRVGHRYGNL